MSYSNNKRVIRAAILSIAAYTAVFVLSIVACNPATRQGETLEGGLDASASVVAEAAAPSASINMAEFECDLPADIAPSASVSALPATSASAPKKTLKK